jgi:uncharacterized protein (TIGR02145 family)
MIGQFPSMKEIQILVLLAINLLIGCSKDDPDEEYECVRIGNQIWMKKNLDVICYRNGDTIQQIKDLSNWGRQTTGAWCYHNNDNEMGKIYGKLYNWYAVIDPRGLAPAGWHIASHEEWMIMEDYLCKNGYNFDGTTTDQKLAKAMASVNYWKYSDHEGAIGNTDYPLKRNSSQFSALPGGYLSDYNFFYPVNVEGAWWTTTESGDSDYQSICIAMDYNNSNVYHNDKYWPSCLSVRCVKDSD